MSVKRSNLNQSFDVEIYDNSGKLVYTENADCEIKINTSDFKSGIYCVKIINCDNNIISSKFVVE
jgi:predicted secreted protein